MDRLAREDENWDPQLPPTSEQIGAQVSRVTAALFVQKTGFVEDITLSTVGERQTGLFRMQRNYSLMISENITNSRYLNSLAYREDTEILPLPNFDGENPPQFPETVGEFWRLNARDVTFLLNFYGIPNNGTLEKRISRLARHCRVNRPTVV
ncbi:hypothetical protein ROZALSC1DRAFT_25940 [Rozella allomycis CSF55]|uniref:Uncharacterized protein n=1 Tax=Rozella allomycis (strain CSF55) TaxID=988480 RepID=A0A4P9Y9K3_ROZAC|nr:hypothetical protein ROZALSC1DRAFT_25940 [Rozella allomycis CSF55]